MPKVTVEWGGHTRGYKEYEVTAYPEDWNDMRDYEKSDWLEENAVLLGDVTAREDFEIGEVWES